MGILEDRIHGTQTPRRLLRDRGTDLLTELQLLVDRQTAVPDKSNELTAIRQLLSELELKGRVVSIDALACQTDIAQTIAERNGWYLPAVKDKQPNLHAYLDRIGAVAHDLRDELDPDRCWTALGCAVRVVDERTVHSCTARHYITNLPVDTRAARNRAALQRIALNFLTILKPYSWPKMSIRRLRSGLYGLLLDIQVPASC